MRSFDLAEVVGDRSFLGDVVLLGTTSYSRSGLSDLEIAYKKDTLKRVVNNTDVCLTGTNKLPEPIVLYVMDKGTPVEIGYVGPNIGRRDGEFNLNHINIMVRDKSYDDISGEEYVSNFAHISDSISPSFHILNIDTYGSHPETEIPQQALHIQVDDKSYYEGAHGIYFHKDASYRNTEGGDTAISHFGVVIDENMISQGNNNEMYSMKTSHTVSVGRRVPLSHTLPYVGIAQSISPFPGTTGLSKGLESVNGRFNSEIENLVINVGEEITKTRRKIEGEVLHFDVVDKSQIPLDKEPEFPGIHIRVRQYGGVTGEEGKEISASVNSMHFTVQKYSFIQIHVKFSDEEVTSVTGLPEGMFLEGEFIKGSPRESGLYHVTIYADRNIVMRCTVDVPNVKRRF